MSEIKLSCTARQEIESICSSYGNDSGELINILHKSQESFGYLPPEVQEVIAGELDISAARVYGVVSFYSLFFMEPRGRNHISVCTGTACFVQGADKIIDEFRNILGIEPGEATPDGEFSLDSLRCIGACGLAPVIMVGEKIYGNLKPSELKAIIEEYKKVEA